MFASGAEFLTQKHMSAGESTGARRRLVHHDQPNISVVADCFFKAAEEVGNQQWNRIVSMPNIL
jgi:hypothetical protein